MTDIKVVLFDLDGTLVDTAPDMSNALNSLLTEEGRQPLSYDRIRNRVSKGGSALIRLGFGESIDDALRLELLQRFLNNYANAICRGSRIFDGFGPLLDQLEQQRVKWGIVTNKPGWLTEPLLRQLGLFHRAACVISGDSLQKRKPEPDPLLLACRKLACDPAQTVYIGDDERDVVAGKAAGMHTLVATYGYIDDQDDPQSWGADGMIPNADGLYRWLIEKGGRQSL